MRAVLQRVSRASVSTDDGVVSEIGRGLCLFVGIEDSDTGLDVEAFTHKVSSLRIFADDDGKMNRSISEVGGEVLVVSQFTLLGDIRRGRRPSFSAAGRPELAQRLVDEIVTSFRNRGVVTGSGHFGRHMDIELVNDGPVTLWINVKDGKVE